MSTEKDPEIGVQPEKEPFLEKPPDHVVEVKDEPNCCQKTWKYIGIALLILLCLILLLILIAVIVALIVFWPNHCYQIIENRDDIPVNVGLDVSNNRVLISFPKPFRTGLIKGGSLAICSKPLQGFDTVILALLRTLKTSSLEIALKSESCDGSPMRMEDNDGTIKLYVADGKPESLLRIDRLQSTMKADESIGSGVNVWVHGSQLRGDRANVTIDFLADTTLSLTPALAIGYSNFEALQLSQLELLPRSSTKNQCGAPAIGLKLPTSIVGTAIRGLWQYLFVKLPPLSKVGVSNYVFPTSVKFADFSIETGQLRVVNNSVLRIASRNTTLNVRDMSMLIGETLDLSANADFHSNLSGILIQTNSTENYIGRAQFDTAFDFHLSMKKDKSITFGFGRTSESWAKLQLRNVESTTLLAKSSVRASTLTLSNVKVEKGTNQTSMKGDTSTVIEGFAADVELVNDVGKSRTKIGARVENFALNARADLLFSSVKDVSEKQLNGKLDVLLAMLGVGLKGEIPAKDLNFNGTIDEVKLDSVIEIAQTTSQMESFSMASIGHPNMATFRMTGLKLSLDGNYSGLVSGQFLETKLAGKSETTLLKRDLSLKIVDLETITQLDDNTTTEPLKLTIMGQQALIFGLHQVGSVSVDQTFGLAFPNASQPQLQYFAVNTTKIVVSVPNLPPGIAASLPGIQPGIIEIPQFAFDFDSTNKTVKKPTSIALQITLKDDLPDKIGSILP